MFANFMDIFHKKRNKHYGKELDCNNARILVECLNYAWHRAYKHKTPISCHAKEIDILRLKFKIIKDSKFTKLCR